MRDTPDEINDLQIVVHNDDKTPFEFVVDLLRSVFARSEALLRQRFQSKERPYAGLFPRPLPTRCWLPRKSASKRLDTLSS